MFANPGSYQSQANQPFVSNDSETAADELRKIDSNLSKYKCYLFWLWGDLLVNIFWCFYLYLQLTGKASNTYSPWISAPVTFLTIITCGIGLSAFNSRMANRQRLFTTFMKILIGLFVINLIILIKQSQGTLIVGRIVGIFVSIIILFSGQNLERYFRRRSELRVLMDRLSVGERYNV